MDPWSSNNLMAKAVSYTSILILLMVSSLYGYFWYYLAHKPLRVPNGSYEFRITPGTPFVQLTQQLKESGLLTHPRLLHWYAVISGNDDHIKAGYYRVSSGTTPVELVDMLVSGLEAQFAFTVVEGWQTSQLLSALQQHPKIKTTLAGLSTPEIIKQLDIPISHLEGVFLPDTYFFVADTTDADFLRRAYFSMHDQLQRAWQGRDPNSNVNNSYEALILASIIEKETGLKNEYAEISGVYHRRLAKHMRLQADPTVIYAVQDNLNGPLLHKHLKINSPYNTYLKYGLPPTPIALPSVAAIQAALHPAPGESIYFVATGTGGHVFSATLQDHNAAVRKLRKAS